MFMLTAFHKRKGRANFMTLPLKFHYQNLTTVCCSCFGTSFLKPFSLIYYFLAECFAADKRRSITSLVDL
jgi:hypothetical protein